LPDHFLSLLHPTIRARVAEPARALELQTVLIVIYRFA
jgi:hypothetical protein